MIITCGECGHMGTPEPGDTSWYCPRCGAWHEVQTDRDDLLILAEECAEVIQMVSKVKRFGLLDRYPQDGKTNVERLEGEVGHVAATVTRLYRDGILNKENVTRSAIEKL